MALPSVNQQNAASIGGLLFLKSTSGPMVLMLLFLFATGSATADARRGGRATAKVEMTMNIKRTTLCFSAFFALTSFVARPLLADEWNKRTEFQFNVPADGSMPFGRKGMIVLAAIMEKQVPRLRVTQSLLHHRMDVFREYSRRARPAVQQ
jgi:hypothetical protein